MDGERAERPKPPDDLSAPGLIYRLRLRGWVLSWSPRSDLTERGYQGRTIKLWPPDATPSQQSEPTRVEWEVISAWCVRYHAEQLKWARGGVADDPKSLFDGTVGSLIDVYQTHKRSPFNTMRYETQVRYAGYLIALKAAIGGVRIKHISFDDISTWQEEFADDGDGGKPKKYRAARMIAHLSAMCTFGALVLPESAGCHALCDVFTKMAKAKLMGTSARRRKEYMTAVQCRLLRIKAHEMGWHSVALAQAISFELGTRQKDVIGEWLPQAWPGVTDIHWGPRKWLMGMRWEDIDADLILTHRLSKSVRGRKNLMDADVGTMKSWDLKVYPMIMDELACGPVDRAKLPASGPLIVCESIGRPWIGAYFRRVWRKIATAAGVPPAIQNRDSRPGAATEAKLAGASREDVQRQLGHAKGETTEIYLREELEEARKMATLRAEKRK
jgi:hypothetical protein